MAKTCVFGAAMVIATVFGILMPAFYSQAQAPPAPAPTSDGTSIDQGIAYVLMLVALVLTYLIHPLESRVLILVVVMIAMSATHISGENTTVTTPPDTATDQISCGSINRMLTPCEPYLADKALRPSIMCCMGSALVRKLGIATSQDRQTVCECLTGLASQFIGLDSTRAALLPSICGIHINFPITSSVNCSNLPLI